MNTDQLTKFIFTHAVAELQKQSKYYPIANPEEGVAMDWIWVLDLGDGSQITFNDVNNTIWKREEK